MTRGTEPHELPIWVVLNERNKEILIAARVLEEVLGKHNLTFADFAAAFHGKGEAWTVDLAICDWQLHDDKHGKLKSLLSGLSSEESELLKKHFTDQA